MIGRRVEGVGAKVGRLEGFDDKRTGAAGVTRCAVGTADIRRIVAVDGLLVTADDGCSVSPAVT